MALTCLTDGFRLVLELLDGHVLFTDEHAHSTVYHLLRQQLAEGPVHTLQDLASLPVLAPVGKGVIGLASFGIGLVIALHGADDAVFVSDVVPDVRVSVHTCNCTLAMWHFNQRSLQLSRMARGGKQGKKEGVLTDP